MIPAKRWGVEIDREGRGRIVTVRLGPVVLWACLANGNEELLTGAGGSVGPIEWRYGQRDPGVPLTSGGAS